ncbi:MAG TPA: enoyl-CoA hydratase/isomerase family protein, partial [Sporichthya sp.]|nr:enoyl-CoA hydratase/isomerase family protein [Sporichthya sp.]
VELTQVLDQVRRDHKIRAVVLASTGKAFSAGGDFDLMRAAQADVTTRLRIVDDGRRLLDALLSLPQPLVVALHGAAIGLGATVVLTADAIVAARSATISDPHVQLGLVAGDGGCLVWPQAVGMLRARRHLLTGDAIPAAEAYAMGLVTDLVDTPDEVLPAAQALAARIAALPPLAVQGTKRALNRVTQQRAGEVVEVGFAHEETTLASNDLLEAIDSFTERRAPNYKGN